MCGIAGIMSAASAAPPELSEMKRMLAMLSHRGPDGYGLYRDSRVGLAHSRLSIIDLAGGAQPLSNQDGTLWLTFNGEIFNYIELRKQLAALGHRFSTNGDSEVIVHCYESRYGSRAWEMLNGQFAFGLWDFENGADCGWCVTGLASFRSTTPQRPVMLSSRPRPRPFSRGAGSRRASIPPACARPLRPGPRSRRGPPSRESARCHPRRPSVLTTLWNPASNATGAPSGAGVVARRIGG